MKLVFMLLVLANLALFAWQQGVFGRLPETGREPERLGRQIEPERIRVLLPEEVERLKERARQLPPALAAAGTMVADLDAGRACVELGDFGTEAAAAVRPQLEALQPGEPLSEIPAELPGWYRVYIPPFRTKALADRAAADIRKLGVDDLLVVVDDSPLRYAVMLGAFRDEASARQHLSALEKRGVKGARVSDTPSTLPATRFRISGVDRRLLEQLTAIQKSQPQSRLMACPPSADTG